MRIACHQPYLFPYRGYFDLIKSVDKFVVYDDCQWIKGGWINRNYFPKQFTFRVKKHSAYADIMDCYYSDLQGDYKRFPIHTPLTDKIFNKMADNYNVAYNNTIALKLICKDLGITTPFIMASTIRHRTGVQGVLDIVNALGGDTYINLPGGKSIYDQQQFGNIKLEFIETTPSHSIICECCS